MVTQNIVRVPSPAGSGFFMGFHLVDQVLMRIYGLVFCLTIIVVYRLAACLLRPRHYYDLSSFQAEMDVARAFERLQELLGIFCPRYTPVEFIGRNLPPVFNVHIVPAGYLPHDGCDLCSVETETTILPG